MSPNMIHLLIKALGETLYMVALSAAIASLFGIPLGVILTITGKGTSRKMRLSTKPWAPLSTPSGPCRSSS